MKKIIVIVGPTAVGKTKLSIELAKKLNAEIINGDSVSIYKDLNIGSAKPTKKEQENLPHHLLDWKDIEEEYSIFDYQRDVRKIIEKLRQEDKAIILVGGSGLYLKAALYDYQFSEGTTHYTYEELTNEEILTKIKEYPLEQYPDVGNRKRLVRLLNKLENHEKIGNNKEECLYDIQIIGLTLNREKLYERINNRVEEMMKNGLLEEVTALKDKYSTSKILNTAIGYKEFYDYFYKEKDLKSVVEEIKKNSRHFAKRQYTFFRHQMPIKWFSVDLENFNNTIEEVYEEIKKEAKN